MKRRILSTLTMLVLALFVFSACADRDDGGTAATNGQQQTTTAETTEAETTSEQTTQATTQSNLSRGQWAGSVWTSDYLGIRFELPSGWTITSDAEIAILMGRSENLFDLGAGFFDQTDLFVDMIAENALTGDSILIGIERLDPSLAGLSSSEFARFAAEGITYLTGMEVIFGYPSIRIGNYEWYQVGTVANVLGVDIHGRQFFNVQGGFVHLIVMAYMNPSAIDTVLSALGAGSQVSESVGAPAVAGGDIIGEWDWMGSWYYTFNEDGSGSMLGLGGAQDIFWATSNGVLYICITPFVCGTLASCLGPSTWSYSINGDQMTLTSIDAHGFTANATFSYTRR